MSELRRQYDAEFREEAVRIVRETKKPIAQVARDLGINPGTLGNWVKRTGSSGEKPMAIDKCRPELSDHGWALSERRGRYREGTLPGDTALA